MNLDHLKGKNLTAHEALQEIFKRTDSELRRTEAITRPADDGAYKHGYVDGHTRALKDTVILIAAIMQRVRGKDAVPPVTRPDGSPIYPVNVIEQGDPT